jgi:hypothetical protein
MGEANSRQIYGKPKHNYGFKISWEEISLRYMDVVGMLTIKLFLLVTECRAVEWTDMNQRTVMWRNFVTTNIGIWILHILSKTSLRVLFSE